MEKDAQKSNKKVIFLFAIIIAILTIAVVPKKFQNDTFFNISIGKYILENKIDMQEHFSWISGLTYTYSHWAFDVVIYLIYSRFGFTGIYCFIILFSILINIVLFILLTKTSKNSLLAFFTVLLVMFLNSFYYE